MASGNAGVGKGSSDSPETSPLSPSHPGASGTQHRQRDFYSEARPIPSIQRFFKRGLVDAIANLTQADSEEEEEEEVEAAAEDGEKRRLPGVSSVDRIGRKIAEHEQSKNEKSRSTYESSYEQQSSSQEPQHATQRRTHRPRLVDDPITHSKIYIHDVGKREYEDAMRQADEASKASNNGQSSSSAAAATTQTSHKRTSNDLDSAKMPSSPASTTTARRFGSLRRRGHQRKESKNSLFSGSRKSMALGEEDEGEDEEDVKRADGEANEESIKKKSSGNQYKIKYETENVLSMPFPPEHAMPRHLHRIHPSLLPLFVVWALLTLFDIVPRFVSVLFVPWMAWWAFRKVHIGMEDHRWDRERRRGKAAVGGEKGLAMFDELEEQRKPQEGIKEGAEWLNSIMEGLWSVMNPELFSSLGATLEDVMQASIPSFIHAVKVEDLAQGSTPLRLTGFRVLPDHEAIEIKKESQAYMRKMREKEEGKLKHVDGSTAKDDEDGQKGSRREEDADASFINLELSFIYRARPSSNSVASKSRNAHLLIKFWVGAKKLVTVPLPVWVEIKGIVGSVRARIQLTPDPPFVKNVTFCFMGLPRVGVEVIPMRINTSNIPLLSGFIQGSIDAAMGEYCAPSSLTMDVGEILMGDNIKREVNALGVVVVYLHWARDLEKQDVHGSSDPYCTIQLAKHGKVQYATRVALNDLSPRWEERYVMLIYPEAIRAREKVSVALWDSDRFSADDMLGRAEVSLFELVKRPGRLFRRTDTLIGLTNEMEKQGTINWSVGFFAKAPNKRRLTDDGAKRKEEKEAEMVDEQDPDTINVTEVDVGKDYHVTSKKGGGEEDAEEQSETEDGKIDDLAELHLENYDARATSQQTRNVEHAVSFEPPSPALPSGIISMQVHSISELEVVDSRSMKQQSRKRSEGQPGQDIDQVETQDDRPNAPNAYVTIILNDETVFRSRTKALSSNPFYNAGTERFVRDWRRTLIMFVVYDNRLRESDAILGVVPIKLTDLFSATSQVTSVFPLAGGVGRGHLRVSLLFRPVQNLSRAKVRLGWDIGTMRILSSLNTVELDESMSFLPSASIRAKTLAGSVSISSRRAKSISSSSDVEWRLDKDEFPVKVPVRRRYATPYVIEFRTHSALGFRRVVAVSILWMQDISDDDIEDYKIPIWRAKEGHDLHRLLQNYHNFRNEEEAKELGVERVGYLQVKMQFKSGVGKVHTKFDSNPDAKVVMDAWRACTSVGLRSVTGDFTDMRINTDGMPVDRENQEGAEFDDRSSDGENDDGRDTAKPRRSADQDVESITDDESEDGDDARENDEEEDKDDRGIREKFQRWKDETKELHRQHKGMKQYKSVRTASWIGRGIRDCGSRALNGLKIQDRRAGEVETEL